MKLCKRIWIIVMIGLMLLGCTGCDTYQATKRYPWYKSDNWYCYELGMQLCFQDDQGRDLASTGFAWTWDGTEYIIAVGFLGSTIDFGQQTTSSDGTTVSQTLFAGRWAYENGNMVVTITEDNLFGGKLTELVFVPKSSSTGNSLL